MMMMMMMMMIMIQFNSIQFNSIHVYLRANLTAQMPITKLARESRRDNKQIIIIIMKRPKNSGERNTYLCWKIINSLIIKHKHYITSIHEQLDRDPKG
jgi:hypothetical protein